MSTAEVVNFPVSEVKKVADLEDGYTRIANDLLEKIISSQLTSRQLNVLLAIVRKTYGYNKKIDWIGNKQLSALTGYAETRCSTIKNELISMNILISQGRSCGINKKIDEWNLDITQNGKTFTKTGNKTFTKTVNRSLPKQVNTKDNITKDNKENTPISPKGENHELINQADSLIAYYNESRKAHCKNNLPFLKALKQYSFDEIKLVIDWFKSSGKEKAKPENICRMTRFDGYLSDAIKYQKSKEQCDEAVNIFNEVCGDRINEVDELTPDRINKINLMLDHLSKSSEYPLKSLKAYFETLMRLSTDLDIKNPKNNWEMTFDSIMTLNSLVKTREKYQRQGGIQ